MRRLALVLPLLLVACGDDAEPVVAAAPASEWTRVDAPPLPERERAVLVWTGEEVLVLGGDRFTCPPAADCVAPSEPPLADGAALDVDGGTWRPVADAPVGFHAAEVAVVGDDVYLLASTDYQQGTTFLRYHVPTDTWSTPTAPPGEWKRLVAAGDALVAYTGSEERGDAGDERFDAVTETWIPLPEDPMTPAFDRSMVWAAPHLYLFDKEDVPNPGSEEPSIVRAARLDMDAGTWERLPDSEVIGGGTGWLVDGERLINPLLGGADGGEVNGWGREHPNGGILDVDALTWSSLPPCVDCRPYGGGAFDEDSGLYLDAEGPVLDAERDAWIDMPALEHDDDSTPVVTAAGRDAAAFVDGAVWIWRAP